MEAPRPEPAAATRRRVLLLVAVALSAGAVTVWIASARQESGTMTAPSSTPGGVALGDAEPAPDFAVPLRGGGSFTLSEHLADDGRPVLLNLWASWCPPCRSEMPSIDAAARRHPEILFLGVAVDDSTEDAAAFADEIAVSYLIGYDEGDDVASAFPASGLPATFLISSEGRILKRVLGQVTEASIDADILTFFGG